MFQPASQFDYPLQVSTGLIKEIMFLESMEFLNVILSL